MRVALRTSLVGPCYLLRPPIPLLLLNKYNLLGAKKSSSTRRLYTATSTTNYSTANYRNRIFTTMQSASDVLTFWFGLTYVQKGKEDIPNRKEWFTKDPAFDQEVKEKGMALHEKCAAEDLQWPDDASHNLARVLLLDQFPRNMFRNDRRSFATDPLALTVSRHMIQKGQDKDLRSREKMFVYMPFMHSESLEAQEEGVRDLFTKENVGEMEHKYAIAHRDIISKWGRFPHRNAILGRESTLEEKEFLQGPNSSF
eukprot:TRINITY_DN11763_c0_g1_i1.p1 TRINITY_DN11763_c0_g1~~TRINITY_DN11763_c0_g1_i1.p1  ORF type:complete len:264 (+),score=21.10 TRINITY_DN11763_c0_g1_i1:28-792(+)